MTQLHAVATPMEKSGETNANRALLGLIQIWYILCRLNGGSFEGSLQVLFAQRYAGLPIDSPPEVFALCQERCDASVLDLTQWDS